MYSPHLTARCLFLFRRLSCPPSRLPSGAVPQTGRKAVTSVSSRRGQEATSAASCSECRQQRVSRRTAESTAGGGGRTTSRMYLQGCGACQVGGKVGGKVGSGGRGYDRAGQSRTEQGRSGRVRSDQVGLGSWSTSAAGAGARQSRVGQDREEQ